MAIHPMVWTVYTPNPDQFYCVNHDCWATDGRCWSCFADAEAAEFHTVEE